MVEVRLARRAAKDLDSLPKNTVTRVLVALKQLADEPGASAHDVKSLAGRRPWRRLRVGNHRAIFRMAQGQRVLLVGRVVDRKDLERAVRTLPE